MTPDLDEIRQALAAATKAPDPNILSFDELTVDQEDLLGNAPTWLAWCLSEIERLRALLDFPEIDTRRLMVEVEGLRSLVLHYTAERDAALAEGHELQGKYMAVLGTWERVVAERDAALAEVERLRGVEMERDAWREDAEDGHHDLFARTLRITAERNAALAEVERLRAENRTLRADMAGGEP